MLNTSPNVTDCGSPPFTAVVTGCSLGLGGEIARCFAKRGYRLFLTGRKGEVLKRIQDGISQEFGIKPYIYCADLLHPSNVESMVNECIEQFGSLDVLVNNAAHVERTLLRDITFRQIEDAFLVNIAAPLLLCRTSWPFFLKQKRGLIINISSCASTDPFPGFSVYGGSKAWLETLTAAINGEGRESNIRAICFRLGAVNTDLLARVVPEFPRHLAMNTSDVAEHIAKVSLDTTKNETVINLNSST